MPDFAYAFSDILMIVDWLHIFCDGAGISPDDVVGYHTTHHIIYDTLNYRHFID